MKLKNIGKQATIILVIISTIMSACTKPNEEPVIEQKEDDIRGRRVRYTVMVVNPAPDDMAANAGIYGAMVSLVMNDSVYNVATDSSGIAKFNNLAAGMLAVRITHPKYSTINMIVDITSQKKADEYDAENIRNASTMVTIFPVEGEAMATVSGRAIAELDLTNEGLEPAIEGLKVSAYIAHKQLINYVNHQGSGKIISIVCGASIKDAFTDDKGNYSIKVPASKDGLKVVLLADDFAYSQKSVDGEKRLVYKAKNDTVTVFSGMKRVHDIRYDGN